ncbi:unnamed protein product [Cylicocyclus nassatus]|uniref:RRM domain-containing protein n=1 Tax=Cylicocyclus nassatus TaxID=53992 RepID=A0AA36H3X4_CYLNA|nr:unnamed protein product [Cylicocyclus nassatus]
MHSTISDSEEGDFAETVHSLIQFSTSDEKKKKKKRKRDVASGDTDQSTAADLAPESDPSVASPTSESKKAKENGHELVEKTNHSKERRRENSANAHDVEGVEPKKKKKKKDAMASKVTTTEQQGYVVGSLSNLFGTSSASTSSLNGGEISIPKGETVIKPKSQPIVEEKSSLVEQSKHHKRIEESRTDRVKQRENRKKAREQRMTLDEKKRTLFVGNAPLSMDERACKKIFSQYGSIESVRMRSVMPNKQSISKRVAHIAHDFHEKQTSVNFYVKYKEEESVQKALAYNGTIVERHRIRVDTCMSKAEYDRKLTVFVGNLPLDANEDELAELFEENVGGVSFARCVKDQAIGMGKGFAFVVFKSPSSVPLALGLTGLQFHKRELRITKVMKKAKVMKIQKAKRKSGGGAQDDQNLTKGQLLKINKFKFSTRKSNEDQRPVLKKKARKAIQRKKQGRQSKSLMQ